MDKDDWKELARLLWRDRKDVAGALLLWGFVAFVGAGFTAGLINGRLFDPDHMWRHEGLPWWMNVLLWLGWMWLVGWAAGKLDDQ